MSQRTIARSYARALTDTLPDAPALRRMEEELAALARLLREDEELREFLIGPRLPMSVRSRAAEEVLAAAGASAECRRFAGLLVRRYRLGIASKIAEEFSALVREQLGIVDAEIVSARSLGSRLEEEARAGLAKLTGREVRARFRVDPTVLGGLRAQVGDTVYDGSIQGHLKRLREHIAR